MVYGSGANNVSEVLIPDPGAVPQAEYLLPGRPTFRDVDLTALPRHLQVTSPSARPTRAPILWGSEAPSENLSIR